MSSISVRRIYSTTAARRNQVGDRQTENRTILKDGVVRSTYSGVFKFNQNQIP